MEITIIGAAILDVLARPVPDSIFSAGSAAMENTCVAVGGDAANEAIVLSSLGKTVELITLLGQDLAGDMVYHQLEARGIFIHRDCIVPDIPTGVNIVLVQENGERCFLTNPDSSLRRLSPSHIRLPFPGDTRILCIASLFVSPLLDAASVANILKAAKSQGILTCADMTKCKNGETLADISPILSLLDYVFPNADEAGLISGQPCVEASAKALYEAGTKNVVIKAGSRGAYLYNSAGGQWFPAVPHIRCVDTTGAGDSFAGGLLFSLANGQTPEEAVTFANLCGSKSVCHTGATSWVDSL